MTTSITINDGVADTEYQCISLKENESIYREVTSPLSNPRTLRISHEIAKSASGTDRHLVAFARTDDNADQIPFVGTVHAVLAVPRDGVTAADLKKEWVKLKTFLDTHFDTIVGGFTPLT
jgi:hypothetical protein